MVAGKLHNQAVVLRQQRQVPQPETAPPRMAICTARLRLLRAALAVRMLALIDTIIPI